MSDQTSRQASQQLGAKNLGRDTHFGTYRVAGFPSVDFDEFHRIELPKRLREGKSDEVAWDVEGVAPLTIRLLGTKGAEGYSFVCRDGAVEIVPGVVDDAATILEIVDHYVQHYNPRSFDLIGAYRGYNQIMPGYGAGEILNIEEMQEHNKQE